MTHNAIPTISPIASESSPSPPATRQPASERPGRVGSPIHSAGLHDSLPSRTALEICPLIPLGRQIKPPDSRVSGGGRHVEYLRIKRLNDEKTIMITHNDRIRRRLRIEC